MSTRISKQFNNIDLLLPSLTEAIENSLSSYFQKTLQKITIFLTKISQNHPNKTSNSSLKRYQDLSNQQITQRSYFLFHIYQGIISLYQFFKLIKVKQMKPSQFCIKKNHFKEFIESLMMSDDELAKLSRIKKDIDTLIVDYKRRILFMLYESQVYIYQILLRVIVIKLVYEENVDYQSQKQQIRHNYFYIDNVVKDRNKVLLNLGKLNQMKHIFQDINCISKFYHCQISISRTECNSKPQMYSLIYLLKIKLNSSLLALILQNCEFNCKQKIIQTFVHPFSSFIKDTGNMPSEQRVQTVQQMNEIIINPINETSLQKIQYNENQVIQRQEQAIINHESYDIQIKIQPEQKQFIYNQEQFQPKQLQQQSKKQQQPRIDQFFNKYQTTHFPNKQPTFKPRQQKLPQSNKILDISLFDLNYKRQQYHHQKPKQNKMKSKKNYTNNSTSLHKKSLQQKLQQMKQAPKRFAHGPCNFYLMSSKNTKRGQQSKKYQQQSKSKQGQILPQKPKVYFTALKDDSQQSFLAEQTPVHKNRAYMKPNNKKP